MELFDTIEEARERVRDRIGRGAYVMHVIDAYISVTPSGYGVKKGFRFWESDAHGIVYNLHEKSVAWLENLESNHGQATPISGDQLANTRDYLSWFAA